MVVTNAKWWDGLPADVRTGLEQAMEQATTYANKMAAELNERDRKLIIAAKKAKVQTLNKDDVAAWRKAMEPVWKKFEGHIGPELIQAALKANNQYPAPCAAFFRQSLRPSSAHAVPT